MISTHVRVYFPRFYTAIAINVVLWDVKFLILQDSEYCDSFYDNRQNVNGRFIINLAKVETIDLRIQKFCG